MLSLDGTGSEFFVEVGGVNGYAVIDDSVTVGLREGGRWWSAYAGGRIGNRVKEDGML